MEYILIFLLGILATAKMSFQTAFCKTSVKNSIDALCFNLGVFITAALLFLPRVFGCSGQVWIYAVLSASFTVMFQLFYSKALSIGNVSLTVLISNFSMVLNVLVSCLVFDEEISVVRVIAISLTLLSFVISTRAGKGEGGNKKWLLFALLTMLSNSGGSLVQKFFGESAWGGENQAYVSCMYIAASVISIIVYNVLKRREKRNFKIGFPMVKHAVAVGISLAVFQIIFTYSLANFDGTFIFPGQTGATIIFSTLSGVLMFKDKLNAKQILGVALGVVSLVLMNY